MQWSGQFMVTIGKTNFVYWHVCIVSHEQAAAAYMDAPTDIQSNHVAHINTRDSVEGL